MNILPERRLERANLGLGGNIGDPVRAMADALQILDARDDCRVTEVSRLYRTPPWGKTDQQWFFNACAEVETSLSPFELLQACLGIERTMKRERIERWGPRNIDVDVLTYGNLTVAEDALTVPHPRMTGRGFVLLPLADYAADLVVDGQKIRQWLAQADLTGIEISDENRDWWRR